MVQGLVGLCLAVATIQIFVVIGSLVGLVHVVDQLGNIRHCLQCVIQGLDTKLQEIESTATSFL